MNVLATKQIEQAISDAGNCRDALNIAIARETFLQSTYKNAQARISELEAELERLKAENQKLKEANRWIPTSERLPENSGHYWATFNDNNKNRVTLEVFDTGTNLFDYGRVQVIAWQQITIPEPYQGEK